MLASASFISRMRKTVADLATQNCGLVMMAEGFHTYPSRTRPLSPPAPMVLEPQGSGRVGRCQALFKLSAFDHL
jgi:hypothetical protein